MGDFEFEESEVIFVEVDVWSKQDNPYDLDKQRRNKLKRKRKKKKILSVPIDIPVNKSNLFDHQESMVESDIFEDDEGEERRVPPHMIWGHKLAKSVTYSVCTRRGRTLKIRDFILKMTGFLEG
ncbi:hypothetical protein Ccrd_017350 [Cynara cardunculus var. scolymus]|uniref:Senescence regulator n=1 Tax=Cynara cardunculus var. scolymus TaxID=59895 RepID=A0A124SFV1_CYNCS|nr:hypothetical protein Ccrd_017350 [Cynara cardunculus var. scolymus]